MSFDEFHGKQPLAPSSKLGQWRLNILERNLFVEGHAVFYPPLFPLPQSYQTHTPRIMHHSPPKSK